jgi:hypothetical protein
MKKLWSLGLVLIGLVGLAQDKEERIKRDVEVAENVLSTLIRQQMDKRSFWGMEVNGSYTPGYGVTLRIPYENYPGAFTIYTENIKGPTVWGGNDMVEIRGAAPRKTQREDEMEAKQDVEKLKSRRANERDSAMSAYGDKLLEASKTFLADYGDLIGLEPNERIMITTKSERGRNYNYVFAGDYKRAARKVISVEAMKSDLTQYKQNKISRDQLMSKFKVMNSEVNEETQPDLELLSTIFSRLYRSDLSKTYFMSNNLYYERLKDFGVTYFMQVYSSNDAGDNRWNMPTQDLEDIDQATRDKKVKELYPLFENDIKSNLLEYGRTLTSLKDEELLIFDVAITKCKGCGIPSTLELSVKASVLKDFSSGKITKDAALGKINVKKGAGQ